jgi:hypothetical protein
MRVVCAGAPSNDAEGENRAEARVNSAGEPAGSQEDEGMVLTDWYACNRAHVRTRGSSGS